MKFGCATRDNRVSLCPLACVVDPSFPFFSIVGPLRQRGDRCHFPQTLRTDWASFGISSHKRPDIAFPLSTGSRGQQGKLDLKCPQPRTFPDPQTGLVQAPNNARLQIPQSGKLGPLWVLARFSPGQLRPFHGHVNQFKLSIVPFTSPFESILYSWLPPFRRRSCFQKCGGGNFWTAFRDPGAGKITLGSQDDLLNPSFSLLSHSVEARDGPRGLSISAAAWHIAQPWIS